MRLFPALTMSLSLLLSVSCAEDSKTPVASDTNAVEEKKPKVALIMKSLANEFFVNMANGAEKHQAANTAKYDLLVNGIKNESDLAQQVNLVDQMINSRVDAIVIAPTDSKALVPALARAITAGIVVVNIDNRLDGAVLDEYNLQIPYVGPSNREGAKLAGDYVLRNRAPTTKIAILEGISSANNAIQRRLGFEDAVSEAGMTIVTSQSASWDQTKAAQITSAILSQHPDLNVILASNDNMALGAASAVKLVNLNQQVTIAGFDNISAIHPLIRAGTVAATVDQFGDKFAVFGIELALDALAGITNLADKQTPVELITIDELSAAEG